MTVSIFFVSAHKRQAALHEIQRLEVEGTLRPGANSDANGGATERGTLTVDNITLPLKSDYIQNMHAGNICLLIYHSQLCMTFTYLPLSIQNE